MQEVYLVNGIASAVYRASAENADTAELRQHTDTVTEQQAANWHRLAGVTLTTEGAMSAGVFDIPDDGFIVARALPTEPHTLYTYTRVPRFWLRNLHGNVRQLLHALPQDPQDLIQVTAPEIITVSGWEAADRVQAFNRTLTLFAGDFPWMLSVLNAALSEQGLFITGYNGDIEDRLTIVQGFMALLPNCIRADLTFSTHTTGIDESTRARITFGEAARTTRHTLPWGDRDALAEVDWTPYVELLAEFWQGDPQSVLNAVDALDPLANCLADPIDQITRLTNITGRFQFNRRAAADDTAITPEELKTALEDAEKVPQQWRRRYADLLLTHALESKDTEANTIIAQQMDVDPELDTELQHRMDNMLDKAPDLVYVFMRQRVGEGGIETRWLQRLHTAAQHSLEIALDSEDPSLILSWLRLIAREPQRFELDDVLNFGLKQSLPLARQDSDFAVSLMVIAARFAPQVMQDMLDNPDLLATLPDEYQAAFLEYDRDALAELQKQSTSLFLAGMKRAADAQAGDAFAAGALERVWALRQSDGKYNPDAPYAPEEVLRICVETGARWLPTDAVETLLFVLLRAKDDTLLPQLTAHLSEQGVLSERLAGALRRGGEAVNPALDTVSMLVSADKLDPPAALDVYIELLQAWGWGEPTQPIIETVARLLTQNRTLSLDAPTLTTMLETSASLRDETGARAAALRLLQITQDEDDEDFVDTVRRVFSLLAWSQTARDAVLDWWRGFVQAQPQARLTRLDKALSGARVAEDALEALRSVAAMRRFLGKRDAVTFAQDVNTAYEVLGTLAGAFEPNEKSNSLSFEPETVRSVLAQMTNDLNPHQRQILSNSLKGLAELVAQMGDNRSKAGLGRRKDNLDRQLLTGEQAPQSAVDAMKWIAGFFSGVQSNDEEE